jgi:hypothetical protein
MGSQSGRLQLGRSRTTAAWFRQDKPLLRRLFSSEKVVSSLQVIAQPISVYPELDEYRAHGTADEHLPIQLFGV